MPEIDQAISHFRLVEKIGGGGMGIVYKAEDTVGISTLTILILAPICHGADFTARESLPKAQKAAIAWHADATLTTVRTSSLKPDGKAIVWQYDYLSPKNVTCARILIVGGGESCIQDLGKCNPNKPVSDKFVDSPDMLKSAVQAGFKPDEASNARMIIEHDSAVKDKACWIVSTAADFDQEHTAKRGWCVNPLTGKFVVRLSGYEDNR